MMFRRCCLALGIKSRIRTVTPKVYKHTGEKGPKTQVTDLSAPAPPPKHKMTERQDGLPFLSFLFYISC